MDLWKILASVWICSVFLRQPPVGPKVPNLATRTTSFLLRQSPKSPIPRKAIGKVTALSARDANTDVGPRSAHRVKAATGVLIYGVKSNFGINRFAKAASRSAAWSATSSETISDGVCI